MTMLSHDRLLKRMAGGSSRRPFFWIRGRSVRPLAALALALWFLISVFQPTAAFAADWDIDQLMQALAKARSAHATFVEKKTMAVLDQPVESSGELLYEAPNRLEKRTVKPRPELMRVDGDSVTIERGRQKHTLNLQEYPELAGLVDSIRGTLAGDRKTLERSFRLRLEGQADRWTLTLLPANAKISGVIRSIEIKGQRAAVRSVEISQAGGDSSFMAIEPAGPK